MVKVGDKLVVQGWSIHPVVEKVWYDKDTDRTIIELDWGVHGKSRIYEHDENVTWYKYNETN